MISMYKKNIIHLFTRGRGCRINFCWFFLVSKNLRNKLIFLKKQTIQELIKIKLIRQDINLDILIESEQVNNHELAKNNFIYKNNIVYLTPNQAKP